MVKDYHTGIVVLVVVVVYVVWEWKRIDGVLMGHTKMAFYPLVIPFSVPFVVSWNVVVVVERKLRYLHIPR